MKTMGLVKRFALMLIGMFLFVQVYAQHTTKFTFIDTAPASVLRIMENNANALFAELNKKYDHNDSLLNISSEVATESAWNRIANMWAISHFYCTRTSFYTRVMNMVGSNAYQVRNIPVCFKEGETDEYKYQSMILEFDRNGKITNVYCTIPEHLYTEVINGGNELIDQRHREMIHEFLNNFFTAYFNKDIDFIEKMFGEDALFIIGKVVSYKNSSTSDFSKTLTNDTRIDYSIQNKKQYMDKLRGAFARNSYINIKFDGVEIVQSEADLNRYGVRLNQYWHTDHYFDEGKFFLLIDFTNENLPEIWVCTWQPFKDANGRTIQYSEEDFFTIGDFNIE